MGRAFKEGLELVVASERIGSPIFAWLLSGIAFAAGSGMAHGAARLLGAAARVNEEAGVVATRRELELEQRFQRELIDQLGVDEWALERAAGGLQPLDETITLARALTGEGSVG